MRIRRVEILLVRLPLRFRVRHAAAERHENVTGFVILTDEAGNVGCGEFLCRSYVMGENVEDCVERGREIAKSLLNTEMADPSTMIDAIDAQHAGHQGRIGAMCGFDLALIDLWSRQTRTSVASWLDPKGDMTPRRLNFSGVYPIVSGWKLTALNILHRVMGIRTIKVKGTGDSAKDIAYLSAIRRGLPGDVDLRLDLNGSLSAESAEAYLNQLAEAHPEVRWLEQPFAKEAWELGARFQKEFEDRFIFCADESVCTIDELGRAISTGAFRAVNLRIAKHGGIVATRRIAEMAQAHGLQIQLGCLVGETSLLAYAGLQLAAAMPQLRYREGCFGRWLISQDVLRPSLTFGIGGRVSTAKLPESGLSPPLDLAWLRRHACEHHIQGAAS